MSDSLRSHGLQPTKLLCPWDFPGRVLWVALSFCRDLPNSKIEPASPVLRESPAFWADSLLTEPPAKPKSENHPYFLHYSLSTVNTCDPEALPAEVTTAHCWPEVEAEVETLEPEGVDLIHVTLGSESSCLVSTSTSGGLYYIHLLGGWEDSCHSSWILPTPCNILLVKMNTYYMAHECYKNIDMVIIYENRSANRVITNML